MQAVIAASKSACLTDFAILSISLLLNLIRLILPYFLIADLHISGLTAAAYRVLPDAESESYHWAFELIQYWQTALHRPLKFTTATVRTGRKAATQNDQSGH